MSTIQNLKNFIRHGKQARLVTPHAEPTTDVTPVHAQQQRQPQGQYANNLDAIDHKHGNAQPPQKETTTTKISRADIEKLVEEERHSRSRMPKYPGLDRYILIEKMGDGAFSNVYRAKDTQGRMEEVAIKVVRKFEMNNNQRANILKEVQIMRQLDHPNIVKLVDFSESPQFYYIVLELCPGGELFHQIVRLTYFSEDLSRHVIKQVAEAIEYLHETSGVVHRDIKPENLLFYPTEFVPSKHPKPRQPGDEDKVDEGEFIAGKGAGGIGTIKIADFGLSKVIWDSQTMTPCGTVGYTAPEIVKDERYSKSVDMWALGCVLYTLLCGFPPFYDESIQVLTEKVARGQYTFLSPWWDDISKSAQDLVSHLLTVDPEKRYTIRQFLDHPWIKQTNESTHAAADAPPLATPQLPRQKETKANQMFEVQQTPLSAAERRMDFRSPGVVNLREVFDVGYAVHRQEEEGKRRKNFRQGYRGGNPAAGFSSQLNPLNEDYDDDEEAAYDEQDQKGDPPAKIPRSSQTAASDVAAMEAKLRQTNLGTQPSSAAQARAANRYNGATRQKQQQQQQQQQPGGYGQHSAAVAAAARQNAARAARQPFELNMSNATLLERRGRRQPGAQVV
ncbi:calcium/calmodulin-dependent protein kinase, putative [Talaromyces stipitatus ATCC 10500]|uniref:Calcium/calmodulin-dependent protein kinase, putative n=1 Tax=Talaromyces stipitatus (strain ATCC 10500 / CBS 375.48 / QM 6759 / NRRL 1006) TaxID=441959 RepID=B8M8C6_TALSN|nr:calcium/calmodulin-dependent protein kinase, putative [Talaromyces stipitatus ATCC 10500]EED20439.1 calcium/calmodulin-dependent protein kinase, putative [Talaromyces stipitatus ATCC 10500]